MPSSKPSRSPRPAFFWQGALVLLPLLVLVAVGVIGLRHDRLSAMSEAQERAQALVRDLLPEVSARFTNQDSGWLGAIQFTTDSKGALLEPRPWALPPVPASLNRAWPAPQQPGQPPAVDFAVVAREFMRAHLETDPAARTLYEQAVIAESRGDTAEAMRSFKNLIETHPKALTESGLPLAQLARVKWFELAANASTNPVGSPAVGELAADLVEHPNLLAPYLLERVRTAASTADRKELAPWENRWRENELVRQIHAAAADHLQIHSPLLSSTNADSGAAWLWVLGPAPLAVHDDPPPSDSSTEAINEFWLLLRSQEVGLHRTYRAVSESRLGARFAEFVRAQASVPEYIGLALEVGGRTLVKFAPELRVWSEANYMSRSGGGLRREYQDHASTNLLATTPPALVATTPLQLRAYLTSPDRLFRAQRARRFWFGSLVAVSALAALVGLFAAYRGFARQQRLNELKSNFVASVSHELRAPIASVRLMAESLQSGRILEPARQHEYFRLIARECRRLSSLIENVLDFSRIEQGRKQYEFEPTDVRALLESTLKSIEPYAAERQVRLEFRCLATGPVESTVDGKALQQAVLNLLDNAVKHSPADAAVVLGLESTSGVPANGSPERIQIWVEDAGPGIPAVEHEKIFERFYRCGSELRRDTQGAGIGLSIVRHIVHAHGGCVRVRSAPGQGSRFTIELPALVEEQKASHA